VKIMRRNITLSVDEKLIDKAKKKAFTNNTSINELFRQWLMNYAIETDLSEKLEDFLSNTKYASSGRRFSRDELNER
jgi:hypothetical protein